LHCGEIITAREAQILAHLDDYETRIERRQRRDRAIRAAIIDNKRLEIYKCLCG